MPGFGICSFLFMFIIVPIIGIVLAIVSLMIMTIGIGPKLENDGKAGIIYFAGIAGVVIGVFLVVSPKWIVYPYLPFDKSVVSVEDGKVVYHRFGFWRQPNVISVCIDGGLHARTGESYRVSVGAMRGNLFGAAYCEAEVTADIPSFRKTHPNNGLGTIFIDSRLLQEADLWTLVKAWANAGLPEGEERDKLIHQHSATLAQKGLKVWVLLKFDPSYGIAKAPSS